MFYEDDNGLSLFSSLDFVLQTYSDERERYWRRKLAREEWTSTVQILRVADALADTLRRTAQLLQHDPHDENQYWVREMFEEARRRADEWKETFARWRERLYEILPKSEADAAWEGLSSAAAHGLDAPAAPVLEKLQLIEVEDALRAVPDRVRRTLALETLVREEFPRCRAPRVSAQFLRLVARCFIAGFDTECVALCRSAIDVALREAVPDESIPQRSSYHDTTLRGRAEAACPTMIDLTTLQAAIRVIERGNKAVHYEPRCRADPLETIRDALKVIDRLRNRR